LVAWGLCVTAAAAAEDSEARYQSLVAAAKADPRSADWQALRFAYGDRPGVLAKDNALAAMVPEMVSAQQSGNCALASSKAERIIEGDYADGLAHAVASMCDTALGRPAEATSERDIASGIFKSMQTGDGLSYAGAFTVATVREEYELMAVRGRRVTRQSLQSHDGHGYDALQTTGRGGDELTFYFLIDSVLAAEKREFGLK
jgi:hypothetical protein